MPLSRLRIKKDKIQGFGINFKFNVQKSAPFTVVLNRNVACSDPIVMKELLGLPSPAEHSGDLKAYVTG